MEDVECVRGHAAPAQLVCRDAEVAELELLALADEDVERREVTVQRLATVEGVERAQDRRDLPPNEAFGLRAALGEPRAEIAVLRILHREAVSHLVAIRLGETVEDTKRPVLASE